MTFRFTAKARLKLKLPKLPTTEPASNLFDEWYVNVFYTRSKYKYFIATNAKTLFSVITPGAGVRDDSEYYGDFFHSLESLLKENDCSFIFHRLISPHISRATLSNAVNRSVLGSMNDLIFNAKYALEEELLSPHAASKSINEMPMKYLGGESPDRSIKAITVLK